MYAAFSYLLSTKVINGIIRRGLIPKRIRQQFIIKL